MVMTNVANIPSVQRKKLEFAYDYQGRRISKKVSQWDTNSSSFIAATNNLFVYDGWNLLAVLDSDLRPLTSFIWGLDLSGSDLGAIGQGAGGVGGLLLESGSASPQFACYDGNGNVTALVATDGNVSARYEYSPCGDILRATGPMAAENSVRWSSKMWDPETDLVYYGFRYYSARLGRFLSRDPLQEPGSLSAYALCGNNPLLRFDPDGRFWKEFTQIITATAAGAAAGAGVGYMSSGLNPAGAAAGGWAGGINGFMAGLSGIVYGQSWGTILGNAAANGALSGLPGGLGTIKPQWGALGGFVAGVGNAALSGADSAGSYAFAAAMGAVFGYAGGEAAAMDSPAMDAVLSAASESGATAALGLWNFFEEALK